MRGTETLARYYFVPAVREGLASYISAPASGERAIIEARVVPRVDGQDQAFVPMPFALFGPGDVLGFDPMVVTRTDPRPNVWDHEYNYMPLVELSEPDLPWRFTPDVAQPGTNGQLTPWITLIALKRDEYAGVDERLPTDRASNALPIRWIRDVERTALPNVADLWQWAHVQVTAAGALGANQAALQAAVTEQVSAGPENDDSHVVARLLCPRRLEPGTAYTAFIVPTFKLGQVAAGLTTLESGESATTPGWETPTEETPTQPVDLPYYYRFEFGTSRNDDFEYLVRLLEPRPLEGLGQRPMDCREPMYDLPVCPGTYPGESSMLGLGGALMSPTFESPAWNDAAVEAYREGLAELLNRNVTRAEPGGSQSDAADPQVVPPIFGRRHAQKFRVDSGTQGRWINEVNLDPRLRAAGGYAAWVVEKDQEALMASVWDQLGSIEDANQMMAHAQIGLEASKGLYRRLNVLSVADFLWISAPVFGRVPLEGSGTVSAHLSQSAIPTAAFDPAFRRVIRGGGIQKRQQRRDEATPPRRDLLSRLNQGEIAAAGPHPKVGGIPSMCDITDRAVAMLEAESEPQRRAAGRFRISGRVVDRYSHNGVRGVRVEAWDRDPFLTDLVGSGVTNGRGWFRFEFDRSYHQDFSLDQTPDVFFRVLRGNDALTLLSPGVLRDIQPGDTMVILEVDQAPGSTIKLPFRLQGQVIDRSTGRGMAWLRVEAWDHDPLTDDLVGGGVTAADGSFEITFDRGYSKEWFLDSEPDLYFKVFRGPELIATTVDRRRGVQPGDTAVVVEIDAPPSLPAEPESRATDFCEPAITCDAIRQAIADDPTLAPLAEVAEAICSGLTGWLDQVRPVDTRPSVDLVAVREVVQRAIDPSVTIPARVMKRVSLSPGVHQRGVLGRIESEIDLPQPMYEPLAAISQDLILPGVETVPQNTISILKTNRSFMEAYMLRLNDSLMEEIIWRGAPVYVWTTCMRQFWDVRGLIDPGSDSDATKDITRIASWPENSVLGSHDPRVSGANGALEERAVLMIRGDLLKRHPDTLVYVVPAVDGKPDIADFQVGAGSGPILPIFSGSLPPDLTFLGLDMTPAELCNHFVVFEERLAEPRFGFDLPPEGDQELPSLAGATWWYDMSWEHMNAQPGDYLNGSSFQQPSGLVPQWGASSAVMANISLQRPVRMCVHASRMLPAEFCEPTA